MKFSIKGFFSKRHRFTEEILNEKLNFFALENGEIVLLYKVEGNLLDCIRRDTGRLVSEAFTSNAV